jgi:hypothetical protein
MISDGCPYAYGMVLIEGVGQNLLPTSQGWRRWRPSPAVATPRARNRHADLFCHLTPGQTLITKLQGLLRRGGMSERRTATHGDAGVGELFATVLQ